MSSGRQVTVIAMHGWAGDSRGWKPWTEATEHRGWHWQCGERGYGEIQPCAPAWPEDRPQDALRVVIGHSLGPHLVPPEVLQASDAVVLLASFGAFVPSGAAARRIRAALGGMASALGSETAAREMLGKFLVNAAAPQPVDLLPPSPADGILHVDRLREDLHVLGECQALPRGLPHGARILIVEAGADRIVDPMARSMLRESLPAADMMVFGQAGHALLATDVVEKVSSWVESAAQVCGDAAQPARITGTSG